MQRRTHGSCRSSKAPAPCLFSISRPSTRLRSIEASVARSASSPMLLTSSARHLSITSNVSNDPRRTARCITTITLSARVLVCSSFPPLSFRANSIIEVLFTFWWNHDQPTACRPQRRRSAVRSYLVIFAVCPSAPASAAGEWQRYANERFGYSGWRACRFQHSVSPREWRRRPFAERGLQHLTCKGPPQTKGGIYAAALGLGT